MNKSHFTNSRLMKSLKQAEEGMSAPDSIHELGVSTAIFFKFRSRFGGIDASMTARLEEIEGANRLRIRMHIEEKLNAETADAAVGKQHLDHIDYSISRRAKSCPNYGTYSSPRTQSSTPTLRTP